MTKRFLMAVCFVALAAASADAQTLKWDQTFLAGVNVGAQASSARTESTAFNFTLYGESAKVTTERAVPSGILFDVFAAARLRGNFGVAAIAIQRIGNSDGAVSASIPSPIFYDTPRTVAASVADLNHRERWGGIFAAYMLKLDQKTGVLFFGGPMLAAVEHSLPTSAAVTEGATPTVAISVTDYSKTVVGYGGGVDLSYMMTRNVGLGAQARYIGATANLTPDSKIKVGGFQVSAGVRIGFNSK